MFQPSIVHYFSLLDMIFNLKSFRMENLFLKLYNKTMFHLHKGIIYIYFMDIAYFKIIIHTQYNICCIYFIVHYFVYIIVCTKLIWEYKSSLLFSIICIEQLNAYDASLSTLFNEQ